MAIGGVVIQFLADSTKAVRGIGKVTDELDSVDSAARDADRALERAEDSFDQLGIASGQAATDLRNDVNRMADGIRDGAGDIDRETGHVRQNMADTGKEAGAEFIGNIAEGIGSGQANLADVVTGTMGGITNLAATLGGPLGIAAAGAAAGIGLVFAAAQREAEKVEERVKGLIGALEDVGDAGSEAGKQAIWNEWVDSFKDAPEDLQKIVGALQDVGVGADQWAAALTGDQDQAEKIHQTMVAIVDDIEGQFRANETVTAEEKERLDGARRVRDELERQNEALGTTKDYQEDVKWLTDGTAGKAKDWADNTRDARTEAQRTKDILDALDGKDVRVDFVANYTGRESDWNPAARAGGRSAAPAAAAAPGVTAAAAPATTVTVNVTGVQDPYTMARIVETQSARWARVQGRPGRGRAVAW